MAVPQSFISSIKLDDSIFRRLRTSLHHVFEPGGVLEECQLYAAGRAVALLGDDNFRDSLHLGRDFVSPHVILLTEDEGDDIGVLLD